MKAWLNRIFRLEEINGAGRCPTYLYRWTLLRLKNGIGVYLHHFVGNDWSRDLHDHPKRFISVGLWGGYTEETPRWTCGSCRAPASFRDARRGHPLYACVEHAAGAATHEIAPIVGNFQRKEYRAPWFRTFPAEHKHRLFLDQFATCWTLVVVLKAVRGWGFWPSGRFVPWREYVGSEEADLHKDCP